MSQVTQGLVDEFRRAIKAGQHAPYTLNEFEQLLFAWEDRQRLLKRRTPPAAPNEGLSQPSIYSREPKPYAMTTAEREAWVRGHSAGWDAALKNEADAGK